MESGGNFWTQRRTIAGFAVCLLAFAEILDLTVVMVAIPQIMGGVGATIDTVSRVTTGYVVAAAICILLSGLVARRFGMKNVILVSTVVFGGFSVLCGTSTSLNELVVYRILQGVGGAFLPSVALGYINLKFQGRENDRMNMLYSLVLVMAPVAGPIVGGVIVEHLSWRWIFFLNVPTCIMAFLMISIFMERIPFERIRIDYISFVFMAIGVGCLEFFVDDGHQYGWLGSLEMIIVLALSVVFIGFFIWRGRIGSSVVDLGLFKNRNFTVSCIYILLTMVFVTAAMAYFPTMLQQVYGYDVETAGFITAPRGVAALLVAPFIQPLFRKFSPKFVMVGGALLYGAGCYVLSLASTIPDWRLLLAVTVLQGVGMMALLVPALTVSFIGVRSERSADASGIINFARNFGVSLGAAIAATVISRGTQTAYHALGGHVSELDRGYRTWAGHLRGLDRDSIAIVANLEVEEQSGLISFLHSYDVWAMGCLLLVALPPFMAKYNPDSVPSGAAAG